MAHSNAVGGGISIRLEMSVLKPFKIQIAGHGMEDGKQSFLMHPDGRILKPVQPPPKGPREVGFYRSLQESTDPVDKAILEVVPQFFGIGQTTQSNGVTKNEDFLILKDITEGYVKPSVIDVKIGKQTWGPGATEKKRLNEDSKYKGTKQPFGFSVSGMIVHTGSGQILQLDKEFGKSLKTEDVAKIPELFFDVNNSGFCRDVVEITVDKMRHVLRALEHQTKYQLIASSLLMSYDAEAVKLFQQKSIDRQQLERRVNVKLIDFANVFDGHGQIDHNFIDGVSNLIKLFSDFSLQRS